MVTTPDTAAYAFVAEPNNSFLALFSHRYDFIWAERTAPGQRPEWRTEGRYPLSDRQLIQGQHLYGVRFGSETTYLMIDVDASSPYHPKNDRLAIPRLLEALEPIGLVGFLPCTSSYSGGLHLYFPLDRACKTWDLAFAAQTLLQRAGFQVAPGFLELFPNPKLYVRDGSPNLYAAHRLPLQEPGSYLLTVDWNPRFTSQSKFVRSWNQVANRNALQIEVLQKVVAQAHYFQRGLSRPASKFLDDLNTEIEQGWTAHGQTNRLLGRIAMRSYIFGHLLNGLTAPLEGASLVNDIVQVACRLPGYREWCRHQHEIESRAEEWARCAENSHYFAYGYSTHQKSQPFAITSPDQSSTKGLWNQQQAQDARSRIARAIAKLLESNRLPVAATARFHLLVKEGIGGGTLYRHRDLWHPKYLHLINESSNLSSSATGDSEDHSSQENLNLPTSIEAGSQSKNDYDPALKSLLGLDGRNPSSFKYSSDLDTDFLELGCNVYEVDLRARNSAADEVTLAQRQRSQWQKEYRDRLQRYSVSGDAILMAEARACIAQLELAEQSSESASFPEASRDTQRDCAPPTRRSGDLLQEKGVQALEAMSFQRRTSALAEGITHREQFQNVVQAIAYHLARLRWTAPTLRQRLLACTGKPSLGLLTDIELVDWLQFLESI
ncbi:MAG: hypothetical protein AAFY26_02300 [Cyanobacteria bacterium J06638_22]